MEKLRRRSKRTGLRRRGASSSEEEFLVNVVGRSGEGGREVGERESARDGG
jgi:hypothetical protein